MLAKIETLDPRTIATQLWDDWTSLWNGDLAVAARIVTDGFRSHFGGPVGAIDTDALRGPGDLAVAEVWSLTG